ncbi:MAG: TlpA family protein disulfide reductase [Marinifilaceae bacterium]
MKVKLFLAAFLMLFLTNLSAQEFQVYNFQKLEPRLHNQNDTLYVINFWAMWCKPCVEELPHFEKAHNNFKNQKVKFLLVSLDFGKNLNQRMHAFLNRKKITPEVIILDDPDSNKWIGKVDPNWDGALPATLIYTKQQRQFFKGQLSYQEIKRAIENLLQ